MSRGVVEASAVLLGRATDEVLRWAYALGLDGKPLALGGAALLGLLLVLALAAGCRPGRASRVRRPAAAGLAPSWDRRS